MKLYAVEIYRNEEPERPVQTCVFASNKWRAIANVMERPEVGYPDAWCGRAEEIEKARATELADCALKCGNFRVLAGIAPWLANEVNETASRERAAAAVYEALLIQRKNHSNA